MQQLLPLNTSSEVSSSSSSSFSDASPTSSSASASSSSSRLPDSEFTRRFCGDAHRRFILALDEARDTFEFVVTEHLRLSAIYWALMSMDLLGDLDRMDRERILQFVRDCRCANGGYAGNVGHDAHLLYTLSAVQIAIILDADQSAASSSSSSSDLFLDADAIASFVSALQQPDGSFAGDEFGEVDTRFTYCALNTLALLHKLDTIDVNAAVNFIASCRNFDGGFGAVPGAESHSGQIFVCVASLAIANRLDQVDAAVLGWWLSERQTSQGGFNGRPEKKPDVCYSWWVLSALSILQRMHWIDGPLLADFILSSQDEEKGGIGDRPGNMCDPFHTYFGLAGLSLLGYKRLSPIDAVYALPVRCVQRLKLVTPYQSQMR